MPDTAPVTISVVEGTVQSGSSHHPTRAGGTVLAATAVVGGRTVAEARGELCACADGAEAWIDDVHVDPDARGDGVARRVVAALMAELRRRGVVEVYTLVHRSDATLAPFFRELGFRERPYACLGCSLGSER
jgi:GNAT superfamily N-acetyltransferase